MFFGFFQHRFIIGTVLLLLVLSVTCQIIIGVLFQRMILETDNMAATENRLLKQCKLKFANCYQMNAGVVNIPVFVDKFLNRISFAHISLVNLGHLSGQLMLLSVFAAGVGACKGIIEGETVGELLPFYIISLFGLYVYFSISSVADIKGRKNMVRTNLIDYLENHMVNHLHLLTDESIREKLCLDEAGKVEQERDAEEKGGRGKNSGRGRRKEKGQAAFSSQEEKELEELLKEFLA